MSKNKEKDTFIRKNLIKKFNLQPPQKQIKKRYRPGSILEMASGTFYKVQQDGSYRRISKEDAKNEVSDNSNENPS